MQRAGVDPPRRHNSAILGAAKTIRQSVVNSARSGSLAQQVRLSTLTGSFVDDPAAEQQYREEQHVGAVARLRRVLPFFVIGPGVYAMLMLASTSAESTLDSNGTWCVLGRLVCVRPSAGISRVSMPS
jgi:hypothetical protein